MKSIVALEIAGDFIRAAEIENYQSSNPRLVRYGEQPVPLGVGGESEIFDVAIVSESLKELWKNAGFKSREVALGIGGRKVLAKVHEFPARELPKIKAALSFEMAEILPTKMADALLDFYPFAIKKEEKKLPFYQGLIVAASSEPIENIIASCDDAKLEVNYVDFNPFALARAARKVYKKEGEYILINARQFSTDLVVMKEGAPHFVRNVDVGLTARKRSSGRRAAEPTSSQAFSPTFSSDTAKPEKTLAQEVLKTVNFYNNNHEGQVGHIVLVGDGSTLPAFQEALKSTLSMEQRILTMEEVLGAPLRQKERHELVESSLVSLLGVGMRGAK